MGCSHIMGYGSHTLSDVESKNSKPKSKKVGKFMAFTTSLVEEREASESFCEFNLWWSS